MTADDAATPGAIGDWYWHIHHEVLVEPLTEPLANRIAYIKHAKPKREVPIRLRWLTPVAGPLPTSLDKASAAYDKASAAYLKARATYDKASAAYVTASAASDKAAAAYLKARAASKPALEALHAQEHPGCPWDGTTLLPKEKK